MKAIRVICLMTIFRSVSAVPVNRPKDAEVDDDDSSGRSDWISSDVASRIKSSSTSVAIAATGENKSDDNEKDEIDAFPTRHAKHRRRRRCKNRATCSRVAANTREHFSPQNNGTSPETAARNASKLTDWNNVQERPTTLREDAFAAKVITDIEDGDNYDRDQSYSTDYSKETTTVPYDFPSTLIDAERTFAKLEEESITDRYRGRLIDDSQENLFEVSSVPSWMQEEDGRKSSGSGMRFPPIYVAIDERVPLHEGLASLLTRLFQTFRNTSAEDSHDLLKGLNLVDSVDEDPCQKWLNSKDKFERAFLGPSTHLPSCPCQYPSRIFYDDKIWDEKQQKYFRWRDASGESQRLDVYKPAAIYCVRSLLAQGSGSAAAQHCCYDRRRRLLTRGSGAGTPNFVSPEISAILHEKIDVLPWRLCKGDFSRFNKVRPPNNDNNCDANPDDEEYRRQIDSTKYY